jgi:CRISPR system Cascade subunit CasE
LADPYQMHRTLLRGFPDASAGGPGRVLFRVDAARPTGRFSVLVQSEAPPNWGRLDLWRDYLLAAPSAKPFEPAFVAGQRLAFRLRANPTVKRDGKRLGLLREEDQRDWLRRKGEAGGFRVLGADAVPEGMARGTKAAGDSRLSLTLLAVRFDGSLAVTDPFRFRATLEAGVGSGKGLGFGLLSVAPVRG